jgi:hypothetical protein
MNELRLKALAIGGAEVLSRGQMKQVLGGYMPLPPSGSPGGNNGNPCANGGCSSICSSTTSGGDTYNAYGSCSSSTGGTTCHNYCCANPLNQATYWC